MAARRLNRHDVRADTQGMVIPVRILALVVAAAACGCAAMTLLLVAARVSG